MHNTEGYILPPRSSFVSVLAWLVMILSGYSTLKALWVNIMINTMYPPGLLDAAEESQDSSSVAAFMGSHIRLYFGAYLVISAVTLASSIGLLKRRNWARVMLICLMTFFIVFNIGSVASHLPELSAAFQEPAEYPNAPMIIFSSVMNVGSSVLCAWIIKRLASGTVRSEFGNEL
jgi:hypothetical protein